MGARVVVVGASGYAGGELLRLIAAHPDLDLVLATAGSQAGQPVTSAHPHLASMARQTFAVTEPDHIAGARPDVVFTALPHGQSAALVQQIDDVLGDALVIDIGADFRLSDASTWEKFYGSPHAGTWVYGLPELPGAREAIKAARRIANPGCYVTTTTLALAPLLAAGLIEPADIVVVAASGTTGAGRSLKPHLLASTVMGSMSAYGVGGVHRHTPEIEQNLTAAAGEPATVSFTPLLAPMPRGILATCAARPAPGATFEALREVMAGAYDPEPFVQLLPDGQWPATASTLGSNAVQVQVAFDEHAGRVVTVAALDNLVKGAAGQAIQNANLALGLDETTGLTTDGIAP